jgi:hypothetical protein
MPPRIRKLKADLVRAGFVLQPDRGKGSHSLWRQVVYHDLTVNLAGCDGQDAKPYQQRAVSAAIADAGNRSTEKDRQVRGCP